MLKPRSLLEAARVSEYPTTTERGVAVFASARGRPPACLAQRLPTHHEIVLLLHGRSVPMVLETTLAIFFINPKISTDVEVAIRAIGLLRVQFRTQESVFVFTTFSCTMELLIAVHTEFIVAILTVTDGKFFLTLHASRMSRRVA